MGKHVAIFKGDAASLILQGKKTLECRFSKSKIPPFCKISSGDLVYIKPSGQDLIGQFRVQKVIFYDGVTEEDLLTIKNRWGKEIAMDDGYWEKIKGSYYATLIFISQAQQFLTSPIKFSKKDLRGWVVLEI